MAAATLDEFTALNDQLAALAQAGVPLDVDPGNLGQDAAKTLAAINAVVARRVRRGESLVQALEDDEHAVPRWYRCLVDVGARSGKLDAALDGSQRVAESVDDSRHAVRSAFFYPLVVCTLAYFGMIVFCVFFVPSLEGTYESLRIAPGSGLRILQAARDTLPYWIAIPPVALLMLVGWRLSRRSAYEFSGGRVGKILSWLPGMSRSLFQLRCANFAETLAILLDGDVPLEEGLPLAAGASGDQRLVAGARAVAGMLQEGQFLSDAVEKARGFPPFLRWALLESEGSVGRARALQMAASVYQESAARRAERLRIIAPIVPCVILGGGITLLYGLALFVPVIQMLRALAS